jgi:hypothetical protein
LVISYVSHVKISYNLWCFIIWIISRIIKNELLIFYNIKTNLVRFFFPLQAYVSIIPMINNQTWIKIKYTFMPQSFFQQLHFKYIVSTCEIYNNWRVHSSKYYNHFYSSTLLWRLLSTLAKRPAILFECGLH